MRFILFFLFCCFFSINAQTTYTQKQLQQKKQLLSQINITDYVSDEITASKLSTPQLSASQLTTQIDIDELYNKKQIKQFLESIRLDSIKTIQQASNLIVYSTKLMSQNISLQQLTSIVNLCENILTYSNNKNFDLTSFKADNLIISVAKLFQNQNLSVDKLQLLVNLQSNIIEFVNKNNISYSQYVPQFINDVFIETNSKTPQLLKILDKDNEIIGLVIQNFKDRYIQHGKDLDDIQKWIKWKEILSTYNTPVKKVQYKIDCKKWMFEVWTPQNEEQQLNLMLELQYIKKKGYDGVVIVWDGISDYKKLVDIQKKILKKGFKLWLAFSTTKMDRIDKTSFVQPQYFAEGLQQLAKQSDAFLMGWRRTSIHLNQQLEQWQNYTMSALRKGNPNIGFIGQVYLGYNGTHKPHEYHLYANYRDNYNAILAVNFGYLGMQPKYALSQIKKAIKNKKNVQYVILVQQSTNYYNAKQTKFKQKSKQHYFRINQLIQRRFLNHGFSAVISVAGNGVNGDNSPDDMCLSKNRN